MIHNGSVPLCIFRRLGPQRHLSLAQNLSCIPTTGPNNHFRRNPSHHKTFREKHKVVCSGTWAVGAISVDTHLPRRFRYVCRKPAVQVAKASDHEEDETEAPPG